MDTTGTDQALAIRVELLPEGLRHLAALSSPEMAIRFAREFGGERIYIPRKVSLTSPLIECLGIKLALLVCDRHGGEEWDVASARTYIRWLDVRALKMAGLSVRQIKRKLGIGMRHIRRLLNGFDPHGVPMGELARAVAELYEVKVIDAEPAKAPRGNPNQMLLPLFGDGGGGGDT